jgi:EAL domain-containing protein (putative c-di-GMP-specific phosphodiesterase class I)
MGLSSGRAILNLLLVSHGDTWTAAVKAAAREIGASVLDAGCSARAAMARLVSGRARFSHLLVQPSCAGGSSLGALLGLTSGEVASGTRMLLLGETDHRAPTVAVIPSPDPGAVRHALAFGADAERGGGMDVAELRAALAGSMIETRYQPIVRLADRAPVSLEALARLNHPARGTLSPDLFVPQAEDAGLAGLLTEAVAARVFADIHLTGVAWRDLTVSLNFPLDVLLAPGMIERMEAQRAAHHVPAARIVIEMTESQPVTEPATLALAIQRISDAGYPVMLDDLTRATPNLDALLDLPFSVVKLDKAPVTGSAEDAAEREFIRHVVARAAPRGVAVVAEGVEDAATWTRMRDLGVDQAQGFLISRALPRAAVELWLQSWPDNAALG